ncbi:MAG: glycoside hydrolase family 15 protein [Candidatus Saccharibacteria bacterium]|nr:glycoside hydrolase family 15 protein [Candidatus Saccharibacteria bacterium]
MGRPVMLGNGSLTVGINEYGLVHDFYYPYVGLDNLTTSRGTQHKIGVWVNGHFSWVDDGSWNSKINFEADAMVSEIRLSHAELGVELYLKDFVDSQYNAFCRHLTVTNLFNDRREIRVFFHQAFQISRAGRADTGLFVPEANYILDYKGRCSLLIYGQDQQGKPFDQFAIGVYGIEGKEGTYRDAEDGELSGSPVEHGGIDSVIRFVSQLEAHASTTFDYWVVAADSQYSAESIHEIMLSDGLSKRLELTRKEWHDWLGVADKGLKSIDHQFLPIVKKSLMLIKVHTDKRGGIIASCDSSIYNYGRDYYSYVWPRDGAYAMWPLIRLGYMDEPRAFFEFCRDILTKDGYLMHKYQPDRAIGSTWHPLLHGKRKELAIQEDETAIVVFMLGEYYRCSKDIDFVRNLYNTLIQPAANFMAQFIDAETGLPHASYDLWEEKFLTNTYTVAVVYQALLTAAKFAEMFEYPDDSVKWRKAAEELLRHQDLLFDTDRQLYRKGILLGDNGQLTYDNTLDISSMYGIAMFNYFEDDSPLTNTLEKVESILLNQSPAGGSPRYEHDHYFESEPQYMGNPWFVTSLWIAQYYIRIGRADDGKRLVDWSLAHSLPSGVLSEQVHPTGGHAVSVTPLVWSHAELINTILDLSEEVN